MLSKKRVKIGIVGCGAIGQGVALFIAKSLKSKVILSALSDLDLSRAEKLKKKLGLRLQICDITTLIKSVDLVIEAASVEAAGFILRKVLVYKKDTVILSVGALVNNWALLSKLQKQKLNLYIPSGAICGIDGLGALASGRIKKVSLITSKPPGGLNLANLKKEKVIFKGKVREAIRRFPKNINVSATLLLSSGFKNVKVCIKVNPKLKRNVHQILVDADEAKLNIKVENIPSKLNPKTSALAILSTQYLLKKMFSSFKLGS